MTINKQAFQRQIYGSFVNYLMMINESSECITTFFIYKILTLFEHIFTLDLDNDLRRKQ